MNQERIFSIIRSPHMSEKAAVAAERRQYVFEVSPDAAKPEIKLAVEALFKTKVKSVRIVSVKPKQKRFRGFVGHSKAWKKAYVTLQPDQKIEFAGAQ